MAVKATGEITFTDLSDAYTVMLTHPAHAFPGTTTTAKAGSTTTQVVALKGATQVTAVVNVANITPPTGVTVTSDNDSTAPTLTIAVTTAVTTGGTITIPVTVDGDVTFSLVFGFTVALTGATGKGISGDPVVTYQASSSGTTVPTGAWSPTIPTVSASQYLWIRVVTTYTDSTSTTAYSVGMMGATGNTGKGISGNPVITYQASSSGTTAPTGTWLSTIPSVSESQYLWTRTQISYTDSTTSTSYSVGMMGATGAAALSIVATTDVGTVFKNGSGTAVATAHVFQGTTELTGSALTAAGTINWYIGSSTTVAATGSSITVHAADVNSIAVYHFKLEG